MQQQAEKRINRHQFPVLTIEELKPYFEDFEKRYIEDALFHSAINCLLDGGSPIGVIEILLRANAEKDKQINNFYKLYSLK